MKSMYNAAEVAQVLGVSPRTISRDIKKGKLQAVKIGRGYIITLGDLKIYLGGEERVRALFGADDEKKEDD